QLLRDGNVMRAAGQPHFQCRDPSKHGSRLQFVATRGDETGKPARWIQQVLHGRFSSAAVVSSPKPPVGKGEGLCGRQGQLCLPDPPLTTAATPVDHRYRRFLQRNYDRAACCSVSSRLPWRSTAATSACGSSGLVRKPVAPWE